MRRLAVLAATALSAAVLLAGCAGTAAPGPSQPSGPATSGGAAGLTTYVALGDSYSAAPGNPTTSTAGGCVRSDHDYPHLVAARLGIPKLVDVTCSGAQTKDFTGRQQPYDGSDPVAPQLDAVTSSVDLVTVSIGGNDLNLVGLLYDCGTMTQSTTTGSPCADKYASDVDRGVPEVRQRVVAAVGAVRRKAPHARILVVGYPQPFPTGHTCRALPLTTGDSAFAASIMDRLNQMLEAAAKAASATYVDVASPSRGHDICSATPWIDGAEATDDAQPLHPFPREQAAVAGLIADALG